MCLQSFKRICLVRLRYQPPKMETETSTGASLLSPPLTFSGTSVSKQQPRTHPGCVQARSFCPVLGHISTLQWIPQTDSPLLPHHCQTWVYYFVQSPTDQKHRRVYRCKDLHSSVPRVQDLLQNHGEGQVESYLEHHKRISVSIFYFH